MLNERWWANRAFPLTVTRQELRRHSHHSSSCQGHKSSAGPRERFYHCQLLSSKEASNKANRFTQELFCFDKVWGLFFFFFFNRSGLHFTLAPSFKAVASENSRSTLISTGTATLWSHSSRRSWWSLHSFPSWAGCRPSPCPCPWSAALWQEVWSKSCFSLCSLQNPAEAWQQTHAAHSRDQHLWAADAWQRGLEDAPSCRTSLFSKLLYYRKSDWPVFTRIDKQNSLSGYKLGAGLWAAPHPLRPGEEWLLPLIILPNCEQCQLQIPTSLGAWIWAGRFQLSSKGQQCNLYQIILLV